MRILAPQRHRVVLRPNQVEAPTRFQQESAREEDPKAEKEVAKRPQQDLLWQGILLQERLRSSHLRNLAQP